MIDYLESFVQTPQLSIYGLADKTARLYNEGRSIGEIAELARRELGISDDNSDLMYQIEKSGIYAAEKVINGGADAYSAWSKDGRPFIILGYW